MLLVCENIIHFLLEFIKNTIPFVVTDKGKVIDIKLAFRCHSPDFVAQTI